MKEFKEVTIKEFKDLLRNQKEERINDIKEQVLHTFGPVEKFPPKNLNRIAFNFFDNDPGFYIDWFIDICYPDIEGFTPEHEKLEKFLDEMNEISYYDKTTPLSLAGYYYYTIAGRFLKEIYNYNYE